MTKNRTSKALLAAAAILLLCLPALSQTLPVATMPDPQFCPKDANGAPYVGGLVYTYTSGTSNALATYTDSTHTSQNANPVVLDSRGCAQIWLQALTYRIKLTDSLGALVFQIDGVSSLGALTQNLAVLLAPAGAANQTIVGPLTANYFIGATAHTTSTGVRVSILDPVTTLDSASNPPTMTTTSPSVAGRNYTIPDPGNATANFVLSPGTSTNTLDCTATGLNCKRYALAIFSGGGSNSGTAGLGWDNFSTNSPDALSETGTNIVKGVSGLRSAATKYQENTNSEAGGTTCTVTYPQATIAGDHLIGWTMLDGTRTVSSVTDGTNAYTQAATATSGVYRLSVYYFNGSSTAMAAASTLTFTYSAAANAVCGFMAYKDVKTSGALDVTATNTGSGTAVTTGTTAGTGQNTELVLSFVGASGNPTVTFATGENGHTTVSQSTNVTGSSQGHIAQATGAQSSSFTLGTSSTWLSAVVTFKANVASNTVEQQTSVLPSTWQSSMNLNADLWWYAPTAPTGTSNAVLGAQVVCTASGSTDDPAFNTATTSTVTVPASVAKTVTLTSLSNISTAGCAASNLVHYQLSRQRYNASDTYEGYINFITGGFYVGTK